jgi:hypothetical protein
MSPQKEFRLGNSPLSGEWVGSGLPVKLSAGTGRVRGSGARVKSFVLYPSFASFIFSNANTVQQAETTPITR